jgi:imidazole glycerol-phosphate synthase subunit HisH
VSVAIIDYGSGNLHSALKAFERAAFEAGLPSDIIVTSDPDQVRRATRLVLPGVGAFADCRRGLDAVSGMVDALNESVQQRAVPFFGICVGMQLMATRGLEKQVTPGLGWIKGDVKLINTKDQALKIPHMGWNNLHPQQDHPMLDGLITGPQGQHAYFVHSYALEPDHMDDVLAVADYGGPLTALIARNNMIGAQFHPEKSQKLGLSLIANFLRWRP